MRPLLEPKGMKVLQFGRFPFVVPPSHEKYSAMILGGAYATAETKEDKKVKAILDLGAGCGEFAVWATKRWPNAWIDCFEDDEEAKRALYENLPPGGRVFGADVKFSVVDYDVVRISTREALHHVFETQSAALARVPILIVHVLGWGQPDLEEPIGGDS